MRCPLAALLAACALDAALQTQAIRTDPCRVSSLKLVQHFVLSLDLKAHACSAMAFLRQFLSKLASVPFQCNSY
eukprot:1591078-Rhodomonas_salina.1